MRRTHLRLGALAALTVACGACGSSANSRTAPVVQTTTTAVPVSPTTKPAATVPRAPPPSIAPTTTSVAASTSAAPPPFVPAFASSVSAVTAADVASSYHAGCPVGPAQLRALHMSYWGFDNQPHAGTMIVSATVVSSVLSVFGTLYAQRFPIRRMQPVDVFGGSDPASMAADNTSAFNCRNAVAPGPPRWSVHAYGEAIDVNTVENPYVEGGKVQPAAGSAFLDRSDHRRGMAYRGGALVSAFAAVGWPWGGRWSDPDYQHFSATGG